MVRPAPCSPKVEWHAKSRTAGPIAAKLRKRSSPMPPDLPRPRGALRSHFEKYDFFDPARSRIAWPRRPRSVLGPTAASRQPRRVGTPNFRGTLGHGGRPFPPSLGPIGEVHVATLPGPGSRTESGRESRSRPAAERASKSAERFARYGRPSPRSLSFANRHPYIYSYGHRRPRVLAEYDYGKAREVADRMPPTVARSRQGAAGSLLPESRVACKVANGRSDRRQTSETVFPAAAGPSQTPGCAPFAL